MSPSGPTYSSILPESLYLGLLPLSFDRGTWFLHCIAWQTAVPLPIPYPTCAYKIDRRFELCFKLDPSLWSRLNQHKLSATDVISTFPTDRICQLTISLECPIPLSTTHVLGDLFVALPNIVELRMDRDRLGDFSTDCIEMLCSPFDDVQYPWPALSSLQLCRFYMTSDHLDYICDGLARREANGCAKLSRLDFIEVDVSEEYLYALRMLVSDVVIHS